MSGLALPQYRAFEDKWYVREYASPGLVDSSPFGWFIAVLHFPLPGECGIGFPPRF